MERPCDPCSDLPPEPYLLLNQAFREQGLEQSLYFNYKDTTVQDGRNIHYSNCIKRVHYFDRLSVLVPPRLS